MKCAELKFLNITARGHVIVTPFPNQAKAWTQHARDAGGIVTGNRQATTLFGPIERERAYDGKASGFERGV